MEARKIRTKESDDHLLGLSVDSTSPYGTFVYHTIYECEFRQQTKADPKMKKFVRDYERRLRLAGDPLRPRRAMRGGRTNAIHHRIPYLLPGHRIYYVDFTSLYPAVNFGINGEVWPLGYPDVYIGLETDTMNKPDEWFGLVKLSILPPRHLLHPVLGESINDKFLFHLCTACATEQVQGPCEHDDSERTIHGTFFTGEIQMALAKGYQIVRVDELWHWPEERRSAHLFRGFMKDQYAKKALSSPAPQNPAELQALIQEYKDTMDLELRPEDFKPNKPLRANAKFSLNNFWYG